MPHCPWNTVTRGVTVQNIEGSTFGNRDERVAGCAIGIGRDVVGLQVIGVGGSKDETVAIGECRRASSGKDGMLSGADMSGTGAETVGESVMLMWVPVRNPMEDKSDARERDCVDERQ